jgi:hypothetical protein
MEHAERTGHLEHESGEACLVLPPGPQRARQSTLGRNKEIRKNAMFDAPDGINKK